MWASEIDRYIERGLLSVEVAAPHAAAPRVSVWEGGREESFCCYLLRLLMDE